MLEIYRTGVRSTLLIIAAFVLYAYSVSVAAESLVVDNYQLISKTQVASSTNKGNDEYEYVYHADLNNNGASASVYDARATVSSTLPQINVIQGNLTFGLVLNGKTITSLDTFTIRAKNSFDTRLAGNDNNPSLLVWNVTAKTDTGPPVAKGYFCCERQACHQCTV